MSLTNCWTHTLDGLLQTSARQRRGIIVVDDGSVVPLALLPAAGIGIVEDGLLLRMAPKYHLIDR